MTASEFKTPTTLYLPIKLIEKLKIRAEKHNTSTSRVVSVLLAQEFSTEQSTPKIVVCEKCGTEYSEKLENCPTCEAKEIKEDERQILAEKEAKEQEIKGEKEQKLKDEEERLKRMQDWKAQGKATDAEVERAKERVEQAKSELNSKREEQEL
jgi:plasmid stability protein